MKWFAPVLGLAAVFIVTSAQAMSVKELLGAAGRIPQGTRASTYPDVRPVAAELRTASSAIRAEQRDAIKAGLTPATCMPAHLSISGRLDGLPVGRRSMSVAQALKEWMVEQYPCS